MSAVSLSFTFRLWPPWILWQSEQDTSAMLCVLAFQLCRLNVALAVWHLRQMSDLACAGRFLMSMKVL